MSEYGALKVVEALEQIDYALDLDSEKFFHYFLQFVWKNRDKLRLGHPEVIKYLANSNEPPIELKGYDKYNEKIQQQLKLADAEKELQFQQLIEQLAEMITTNIRAETEAEAETETDTNTDTHTHTHKCDTCDIYEICDLPFKTTKTTTTTDTEERHLLSLIEEEED